MNYGETIVATIHKLEKTMVKYSSYTNNLQLSLPFHHYKIVPKDQQLNSRIKAEGSKIILQCAGKLLLQEQIHINHVICDRLNNRMEQLNGKILESTAAVQFHLLQKNHENLYKAFFDLAKKRHIPKFDELISNGKVTQSAANIT